MFVHGRKAIAAPERAASAAFVVKYLIVRTTVLIEKGPVSYTHLDVYKRQVHGYRSSSTWREVYGNCEN